MSHAPTLPPELATEVPGPRSRALAARLRAVESRNVTCLVPEPPIFWERAAGANVWDVDGNRYVDLGARSRSRTPATPTRASRLPSRDRPTG